MQQQPNNPLHGVTLQMILEQLVECYGWEQLYVKIPVNCFKFDPSIQSCLKFFRRTPWAREKLERLYLYTLKRQQRDG